jgi:hypothetical protein
MKLPSFFGWYIILRRTISLVCLRRCDRVMADALKSSLWLRPRK